MICLNCFNCTRRLCGVYVGREPRAHVAFYVFISHVFLIVRNRSSKTPTGGGIGGGEQLLFLVISAVYNVKCIVYR